MATILIVEDERSIRQALLFELEDEGHHVFFASNFQEAVSALRAFSYDIIISDIFLGDGTGLELMNMIKRKNRHIPFIAITAYPESELALRVKAVLKDCFFEKPFSLSSLLLKVKELLTPHYYEVKVLPEATA
jgi:DNA-binding response OmpR family regulator